MPQPAVSAFPETENNQAKPVWIRSAHPAPSPVEQSCWMVLSDGLGVGEQLVFQLRGAQKRAIKVTAGNRYARVSRYDYVIRPAVREDYRRLARSVLKSGQAPTRIVHLWSLRPEGARTRLDESLELGLCSIPYLLQELSSLHPGGTDIAVVSNALQSTDESLRHWFRDSVVRLQGALAQEFPQATCRSIDVDTSKQALPQIAVQLVREHSAAFADPVVAYRGDERWVDRAAGSGSDSEAATGTSNGNGWQAREDLGAGGANQVEALLEGWWRELLMTERVSADDDFFDLGGDSIIAVQLFRKINSRFGIELGLSTIFDARTVRQLADVISQAEKETTPQAKSSPAVVAIQPKGQQPPIYVISGVGGNVIKFQKLAFYLGEDQPMFGLLPRGLDGKEPYFTRIEDMAGYYADAIQDTQPVGAYQLMGYSFGGLVAYEVARQLVDRGGQVSFLGLLDSAEPQYLDRLQRALPRRQRYRAQLDHLAEAAASRGMERLRDLFASKLSALTFKVYRTLGRAVPQDLGKMEYISLLAGTQYHPGPYSGKATIFRSTIREISEGTDRDLGWEGLAAQIEVIDIPSNHFNLFKDPNVGVLAEKLKSAINANSVNAAQMQELRS
ncbi:MAG: thioesterase domain-containing protein [Candidatus Acidiferrales bacterium]